MWRNFNISWKKHLPKGLETHDLAFSPEIDHFVVAQALKGWFPKMPKVAMNSLFVFGSIASKHLRDTHFKLVPLCNESARSDGFGI